MWLKERGIDWPARLGRHAVYRAARGGSIEMLEWLREEHQVDFRQPTCNGESAVKGAACSGHQMRYGRHYATFSQLTVVPGRSSALLGVVGPDFSTAPTDLIAVH